MTDVPGGRAHARSTDPDTSHAAAAGVGELTENQRAVMTIMQMGTVYDKTLLDEELVELYAEWQKQLLLPRQSESGIRSRRAELANIGLLEQGDKRKMSTGSTGRTWKIKET